MSYLFGDSTPSPFRINFVEFLRLALGFSVHVLQVEERVVATEERRKRIERDTETDRQHLDQLLSSLTDAIQNTTTGVRPRVAEHAETIQRKAQEVVESGWQSLEQAMTKDLAEMAESVKVERKSSLSALEKVLLVYDLPEAKDTIRVRLGEGGRYSAWLESVTPYGLETTVDLSIPAESLFAHEARVERFADGLEIHAPETAGWIRKESRMVPQKLGRLHVVEVAIGESSLIKLRSSTDGQSGGYDISLRADEPQVVLLKVGKDSDDAGPFDPEPGDIATLQRLRDKLEEACQVLSTKRRAVTQARVDGEPIDQCTAMRSLVEKLVQVMAPMVREIAAHSLSPDELVLRRMMGDGRREEIFITKAELRAQLDELGEGDRRLFEPLQLGQSSTASAKSRPAGAASDANEEKAPPSGVKRSNRPPPMPAEVAERRG